MRAQDDLTTREIEVLKLIAAGLFNTEIAAARRQRRKPTSTTSSK